MQADNVIREFTTGIPFLPMAKGLSDSPAVAAAARSLAMARADVVGAGARSELATINGVVG